jgi:hypothetical protein
LHGIASVQAYVENTEQEMTAISKIFSIASSIPFSPYPLGRSLIKFFGLYHLRDKLEKRSIITLTVDRYGKWLKNVNTALLGTMIQGFLPALDNLALAPSAAEALKSITSS